MSLCATSRGLTWLQSNDLDILSTFVPRSLLSPAPLHDPSTHTFEGREVVNTSGKIDRESCRCEGYGNSSTGFNLKTCLVGEQLVYGKGAELLRMCKLKKRKAITALTGIREGEGGSRVGCLSNVATCLLVSACVRACRITHVWQRLEAKIGRGQWTKLTVQKQGSVYLYRVNLYETSDRVYVPLHERDEGGIRKQVKVMREWDEEGGNGRRRWGTRYTHTKSLSPLITYPHTHSYTGTHFYKLNQCKWMLYWSVRVRELWMNVLLTTPGPCKILLNLKQRIKPTLVRSNGSVCLHLLTHSCLMIGQPCDEQWELCYRRSGKFLAFVEFFCLCWRLMTYSLMNPTQSINMCFSLNICCTRLNELMLVQPFDWLIHSWIL